MTILQTVASFLLPLAITAAIYVAAKLTSPKRKTARTFFIALITFATPFVFVTNNEFLLLTPHESFTDIAVNIAANLYHFAVSTWGIGILGLCLFIKGAAKPDENTVEDKPDFRLYSLLAILPIVMGLVSGDVRSLETAVAPLILLTTVGGIYIRGLELRGILTATTTLGVIFSAQFLLTNAPVTNAQLMGVSVMFSFMSLLIVFVSCGGRFRTRIITAAITAVVLFSTVRSVITHDIYI
ncbi:MAG: hypothetical protein FWD35_06860 [Oscillospiraceae bacterium]|nr:hypothetical protein [Oscillospiraceae bacterium]